MLSETYRQSSHGPAEVGSETGLATIDPENRLLWRMNEHRLSFEEMRDSLLAAAGQLDRTVGGRPGICYRRSSRGGRCTAGSTANSCPNTLRVFDFANPDLHIPLRSETTVPQQALYFSIIRW